MKKINTIIFDLDGTLLDTLDDLMSAVNYALSEYNMPERSYNEIRGFVGNGVRNLIKQSVPDGTDIETEEEIFNCFKEYYKYNCNNKTRPYEGIKELLSKLYENGYQMAIVSNKIDTAVQDLLKRHFYPQVKLAYGEREGIPRKPNPEIVHIAMREMEADAESCIYIGDSEVDFKTAENAGIGIVMVSWGFRDKSVLKELGAKYIADNCEELFDIINSR